MNLEALKTDIAAQLQRWQVPGCALAIVQDGEVVYSGGIGTRDNVSAPVTGQTLVQIASCSKAFTATLAGVLATEGLLDFDTPIINYMPDFRLNDDYATMNLTIRDFLCHRTGLPRHELAWYGTGFSREQLMQNLRYLPLNAPIRYRFQYCNFNYLIVGALIERVTGMRFEDALKTKLLEPLGMTASHVYLDEVESQEDHMLAFDRPVEYTMDGIRQIPYYRSPAEVQSDDPNERVGDPIAPAGCIVSCPDDMVKWLQFNLNGGKVGDIQLVRPDLMELIRSIHVYTGEDPAVQPEQIGNCYALGWSVYNYRGMTMVEHGGNLNGFSSSTAFFPEKGLGIFLSVNMNTVLLPDAIVRDIADKALGMPDGNWYDRYYKANEDMLARVIAYFRTMGGDPVPNTTPSHDLAAYAGTYEAPGYRRFLITCEDGELKADFNTFLTGLRHYHYDTFATTAPLGEFPSGVLLTFGSDVKGDVKTITVMLGTEPGLKPIVFTKE